MRSTKIILCLLITSISVNAQKVEPLLKLYNEKLPAEKIHLHYDKEIYVAGESVWFKAYLMNGLEADTISSSLFVEFSDPSGKIIMRKALPVVESTAFGNLDLPDSLRAGNYSVRAYTTWMMNFESDLLYHKKLYVYNKSANFGPTQKADVYTVNFFPESGNLIADVVNFVGIKATNASGYPVELTGSIMDSKGNSITDIKTTHDGMGRFTLLALTGETYYADIKFSNGKVAKVQLPSVKEGLAIHVDEAPLGKRIAISRPEASGKVQLVVVGVIAGNVVFEKLTVLESESMVMTVATKGLPSGILQLTILDKDLRPIMERLTFVNSNDYLIQSNLIADTISFNKRGKIALTFSIPDTIQGNYSVAITDDEKVALSSDRETIISRFLLSSGLKGYIHNPAFYFSNNDKKTRDALDLVMLTHGWRKINWEQVVSKHYPALPYKPVPYITISGKVFDESGRNIITSGDMNFVYKTKVDSTLLFASAPVDEEGKFVTDPLVFSDTASMVYNLNTKKKSKQRVQLKLDRGTIWPVIPYIPAVIPPAADIADTLKQKMKSIQDDLENYASFFAKAVTLKEVKITGRKKSPTQVVVDKYTTGPFGTFGGRTFDLITNPVPSGTNLINYLRTRIPRINITGANGSYNIVSGLTTSFTAGPQQVTIFMDEMQTDINWINNLPIDEIALIKYEDRFVMSPGNGPAIMIYQKRPEDMTKPYSSSLPKFYFPGYTVTRQFYSPDYAMPDERHSAPDVRTTLFWDPNVLLDKENQKQKISFYNSDNCKRIRVIIEGFAADGRLCRIEKVF